MADRIVRTSRAPKPVGAYPHARRVGGLLFLSGVGPRLPDTNEIPGNVHDAAGRLIACDFEAQCRSVFANVRAILEASGARWEDLVDVTVYLTDMARDFAAYNRLYAEYFRTAQPCRTTLGISALPTPIAIELKCVAKAPRRRTLKAAAAIARAGRPARAPTRKARPARRRPAGKPRA